jgi:hypothetical protein
VIANVFCFIDNATASLNDVMEHMRANVAGQEGEMI